MKTLEECGVEEGRIFTDKKSGKNNNREGLIELCDTLEALNKAKIDGVHLYCTKMDRLGRSTLDMLDLIKKFDGWNVKVHFIHDGLSTGSAQSELILTILSAVATAHRSRILESTNEGRMEALANGVQFGAKRSINRERVLELHREGKGATAIAKELNIKSRSSVYRVLKENTLAV
jgi:DNA invertase Pin-like site-specific DNA recombinase